MKRELKRLTITFTPKGLEYAVVYDHTDEPPTPGTKTRTRRASQMTRKGLEEALRGLEGDLSWGGFGTDTRTSRDVLVADRRGRAA